jgi:hypothetical protein
MTETKTARIELSDEGLVIVRIKDGAYQSLADAEENLAVTVSATAGKRRPLLVDIRHARPLEAEVRHYYSGQTLVDRFSAMALLVDDATFGWMMGNVYLEVAKPGIPTQLYSDEAEATKWLNGHRT